ncbi:MAG: hypothetical protein LBR80_09855 [Deltaproteobacteria bacterium]|nr:hypothetical protein [Deltaproteobacteria bacterium]
MLDFYRPVGSKSPFSILIALASASTGYVLAPLYATVLLYSPIVYVNAIALVCYGTLTGLAGGMAAKLTRTLNPPLAGGLAMLGGWVGFILSWSAWLSLIRNFGGTVSPDYRAVLDFLMIPPLWNELALHPREFLEAAIVANGQGAWSVAMVGRVSGIPLLCVWIAEFLIFSYLCAKVASRGAWAPYSHEARAYLRKEPRLSRGVVIPEDIGQYAVVQHGLMNGDLTYLSVAPVVRHGDPGFYVALSSHEKAPWGVAEVTCLEPRGRRLARRAVADRVILTAVVMRSLRARLG